MSAAHKLPKSRIILGLMTFGPTARVKSMDEFKKCLDLFQSHGYDEVDTARIYDSGSQEGWSAKAGWKERGLKIATKSYPSKPGLHKASVLTDTFNTSLKELQTDRVDIFYLHAADRSVPFTETLEAVDKLHKQGKFGHLGLSNYTAFEVAEIVMTCQAKGWVRPTIYQGVYNCITRGIEAELIPACRRYGLDVVIYSPLGGGLLTGRYKDKSIPEEGRFSGTDGTFGEQYRKRYFQDASFQAVTEIEEAAKKHNLTVAEVALRWVVHHSALKVTPESGGNDGIIIGASSCDQLKKNLEDLEEGKLPQDVVDAVEGAWMKRKAFELPYWHMDLNYGYNTQKVLFGEESEKK